jgi:hypothetical protein
MGSVFSGQDGNMAGVGIDITSILDISQSTFKKD